MTDLGRAVDTLVETAGSERKGKALQRAVGDVVRALPESNPRAVKKALDKLDSALADAEGQASQVLHLTIGALVEGGAPPEAAWPAIGRELGAALERAARFALACAEAARTQHLDTALEKAGAKIAKKLPAEAAAWDALPARCLSGIACLTRSARVRATARTQGLFEAAYPLESAVAEVGHLAQALRVLDDEPLLVLHPALGRGFRTTISEIGYNGELFALLVDALVGEPTTGALPGKRIDRRAIAALTGSARPPKGSVVAPFNFVAWTALSADGSLAPADEVEDHWISLDGVPADIPAHDGTRVVLLQEPAEPMLLPSERIFEALSPEVRVVKKLPAATVQRVLLDLGRSARKTKRARPR